MYYLLMGIFVIVCLFLIAVILLQAGRGAGLTEAFGGSAGSVLGTQAPAVLKKATTVSAILFLVLALLLAVLTTKRGRSLFQ
ncbi:MAG: preprotein translocase subunit SecG [Candidatus Omnitrophica bacterium]|nr:preprotein translocase subunit SecG [Candidatus Omnitrophota bacterium]